MTTTEPTHPLETGGSDPTPTTFAEALHRLADLIECDEAVPVPDACTFTWHLDDDDTAVALARALADTHGAQWRAKDDTRDGGPVIGAKLLAGRWAFAEPIAATVFVRASEPVAQRTASERLAAELERRGYTVTRPEASS